MRMNKFTGINASVILGLSPTQAETASAYKLDLRTNPSDALVMKSMLISLAIFALPLTLHADQADQIAAYFGKSNNKLLKATYKKSIENGYITYTRKRDGDTWIRAIKPFNSAFIKDDIDDTKQRAEYLAFDVKGKLRFRTSCMSKESSRTATCITLLPGGKQTDPVECKNDDRDKFECVTVSKPFCKDFDRLTGWFDPGTIATESKIKECTEIINKLSSRLPSYVHLTPYHKVGLERIRDYFKIDTKAVPEEGNPIIADGGFFKKLAAFTHAKDACNLSENQWGEDFTEAAEPINFDFDGKVKPSEPKTTN